VSFVIVGLVALTVNLLCLVSSLLLFHAGINILARRISELEREMNYTLIAYTTVNLKITLVDSHQDSPWCVLF
jgi:uncharacterized membrane protein YhaH (DUF805 family)